MDKTTAQRIVRNTLKASFDKKRFRDFINELCNGFDETKSIPSMGVPDAFKLHVSACQRLGTFESPDGELADILVVHLTESFKLERTRTALRDFVAHKLKRDESYKEAGLVAFVAPDTQSWRLSFVRMEYETKRDPKTGKIKPEERLTPARRYSYLVGAEEECHTAQSRFLALLQNISDKPTLAVIEDAFSVESVTKEFFAEYKRLFEVTEAALADLVKRNKALRTDFESKNILTVDFTKKLLGQIVFLYFIQKKGWLGVPKGGKWGDGPRNFLRLLANKSTEKDQLLFNDIMEPLFYDTLATDRGHDAWCKIFQGRIPFLNGGLFEPLAGYDWKNTEIKLPNTLFTNNEISPAGDAGTGILDVFDRYNFTVNEAEPLEIEVAIDPEMLGKVFENLIEENRRKGLGAFYTPREIVHDMCQESLINYLDTELNLSSDKKKELLIPREEIAEWIHRSDRFAHYSAAIAAGTKGEHYPKPPESIRKYAREIDKLLQNIAVCDPATGSGAFLVGMMTEIVRARAALTPYFNDTAERTAYHFKRHAIQQSLYGVDIDAGAVEIAKLRLWLSLVVDEEDVQQIKPLPNLDYKIVVGNSLLGFPFKSNRISTIEKLKSKYFDETDHKKKMEKKKEIDLLISECFASSKKSLGYEVNFDFDIYFPEVFNAKGGFDVVIANPPYVDSETMVREAPQMRTVIGKVFITTKGNWDLYIPFLELSLSKLSKSGTSCLITPNKWLAISYGKAYRDHVRDRLYSIADYSRFRAFENVGVFPVVSFASSIPKNEINVSRFSDDHQRVFSTTLLRDALVEMSSWGAVLSEHLPLLNKLISKHKPLKSLCSLEEAFTVGEAYKLPAIMNDSRTFQNVFKFVNTGTIEPFYSLWGYSPTTYLKTKYTCPVVKRTIFKQHFPKRYIQMSSPKIVISGMRHFEAVLDLPGDIIAGKSTVVIRGLQDEKEWLSLLGILNSRIAKFYLKECYSALAMDGGINFSPSNVGEIPIPKSFAVSEISKIANKIIELRDAFGPTLENATEQKLEKLLAALDAEVFSLYGLSRSEVATVLEVTS